MARPLRIEFPGAIYHVTARGDRQEPIFETDGDRQTLLRIVDDASHQFDATVLAYCLMGNHYHFVIQTHRGNLSLLMRQINGVYTQRFNRRHQKVGHLFQGRFKAILVDREPYLLEVCRYVELNPVRSGAATTAADWPWSSYRAHAGQAIAPRWLGTDIVWGQLLGRDVFTAADRERGARRYEQLVASARDRPLWESALQQQIYLGDATFVGRMQAMASPLAVGSPEVPKPQRNLPMSLAQWMETTGSLNQALARAHRDSGISMTDLAREIGLSVSRVSQLIRRQRAEDDSKFQT